MFILSTQSQINQAETYLKQEYGYTKEMLEKIGIDCPTSDSYLEALDREISKLDLGLMDSPLAVKELLNETMD